MNWNSHYALAGKHAFLSASNYHWLRYTPEKLADRWQNHELAARGTMLHALAHQAIELGVKFANPRQTLSKYVNDAIGFRMKTEQVLYYSDNCFGTADTISFRKSVLRISDLKTGLSKASMDQLLIYAALFCLEYGVKPEQILIELRIYQNDGVEFEVADTEAVRDIMNLIIEFDHLITTWKLQEA